MSVIDERGGRREPAERVVERARRCASVQPCTASSPPRWSSPTATGTTGGDPVDQRRVGDRGRAHHHAGDAGVGQRRGVVDRAHAATGLHLARPATAAAIAATTARFVGVAGAGRVEVDDVDPRGAALRRTPAATATGSSP